jgi:hypothetical protein
MIADRNFSLNFNPNLFYITFFVNLYNYFIESLKSNGCTENGESKEARQRGQGRMPQVSYIARNPLCSWSNSNDPLSMKP